MSDPPSADPATVRALADELGQLRKYRQIYLPEVTLFDLVSQELARHRTKKEALQAAREKLHNIVAPYLGDPDYRLAAVHLSEARAAGPEALRTACLALLNSHVSTRERIPFLDAFYPRLWQVTGKPASLLDLACGLHPFGLPWMGLDSTVDYHAYDLHKPRVDLINQFFELTGQKGVAVHEDILVNPPQTSADVALFFKEAHRFEQRRRGCNLPFWQALQVRWLLVSLPSSSLGGRHSLVDKQHRLMDSLLAGQPWEVEEILFENEMVFCIRMR